MRLASLLMAAALALFLSSGRARAGGLTGKIWEYIQPTNPVESIFNSLSARDDEYGLGLTASPNGDPGELSEALRQFADVGGTMERIEAIKREKGIRGGLLYNVFEYDDHGRLNQFCGISSRISSDLDEVRESSPVIAGSDASGLWRTFKLATREERVRTIARCLSRMTGMPLRPAPHEIKRLYIDAASYRGARSWLRGMGYIGNDAQYDEAFRCMLTYAGRESEDAVGDSIVVRSATRDAGEFGFLMIGFAVMNSSAAAQLASPSVDITEISGPWPNRGGFASNAFESLLQPVMGHLEQCRQSAGLLGSNGPSLNASPAPNCPH